MPPDTRTEARQVQMLVTGMIVGAFLRQDILACKVTVPTDDDANYLPEVHLQMPASGTRLRIRVEVEDG
jgi:hypothetical protein